MHKHILVPLDGSSFGERALRPAFALARRTGAAVTLLSVQDLWSASAADLPYEERGGYVEAIARRYESVDTRVKVAVRCGHPTEQILAEAESGSADLVVMSTHGRGGLTRLWLGSVADQCLRYTSRPLFLIRPQPAAHTPGDDAFLPRRVVVPLDGTPGAERALDQASGMARAFGIPIVLLRVLGPLPDEVHADGPRNEGTVARTYLDGVAQRLWRTGVQASTVVVGNQSPADAILGTAAGEMVVMSTHARSPIARALIGSVADKVVRGAHGPVLLVPPPSPGQLAEPASAEAAAHTGT
jgi:nucleotide-binding universal stress UspA family protein